MAEEMETNNQQQQQSGESADDKKLFVGGLPQDITENEIKEHFSKYGEIEAVNLKTDPATGRSRGFAFVAFANSSSCENVCNSSETHTLKGKNVAVKRAQSKQGKVYVGKLVPDLSDDEIKEFFSQYGAIAGVEQPFDKQKNERKNFCFITFEKEDVAKRLLKEGSVSIKGHTLEVKKVTPKPDPRQMAAAQWATGGYGAPWGGYGDYWGGYGGYGAMDQWGGAGGWGYGGMGPGGWGGYGGPAGGKAPRGRGGASRGGRGTGRGARQKPY